MDKAIEEIKKRWENIEVELSKGSSLCLQLGDDCWQDIQILLTALQKAELDLLYEEERHRSTIQKAEESKEYILSCFEFEKRRAEKAEERVKELEGQWNAKSADT